MTRKVNGKMETLTPCRSETPENIETKIGQNDYVMGPFHPANFRVNRSKGVSSCVNPLRFYILRLYFYLFTYIQINARVVVILSGVVVVTLMTVFLANDRISFHWRERLESLYVWRHWSNISTLAE